MKRIIVFISLLVAVSLVLAGCGCTSGAANHLDGIKQAGVIKGRKIAEMHVTAMLF